MSPKSNQSNRALAYVTAIDSGCRDILSANVDRLTGIVARAAKAPDGSIDATTLKALSDLATCLDAFLRALENIAP